MTRIMTATEPNAATITVDGELTGKSADALETLTKQELGQGRPVFLCLREISGIDEGGRALLRRLAAAGVRLSAPCAHGFNTARETPRPHSRPSAR